MWDHTEQMINSGLADAPATSQAAEPQRIQVVAASYAVYTQPS